MAVHSIQPPETDLIGVEILDAEYRPHTVHTHYFGFCVPEAGIGAFTYIRYQPYFRLTQGNVVIFQGHDNLVPLDVAHLNRVMAQPWPTVEGHRISTSDNYAIEFLELGSSVRVTYEARDGSTAFALKQEAVTPLIARGSVIPGEDIEGSIEPGGSEQFMHVTGELTLHGETYPVNCVYPRDRSWNQDRTEERNGRHPWPVSWTPVYFGNDLCFNQVGFEDPDLDPTWKGLLEPPPAGSPGFHFAWAMRDGRLRDIVRVRRNVTEKHALTHIPLRQEIEAEDDHGHTYHLTGEAIASAPLAAWYNAATYDSVYRWTDDQGREAYGPVQGIWYEAYQHALKRKRLRRQ
jgi:hypothetical protein